MADLTPVEAISADPCCAPEQQASCCEPSAKAECCGHGDGCGCDAAQGDVRSGSASATRLPPEPWATSRRVAAARSA
jgi:hypothetical protein